MSTQFGIDFEYYCAGLLKSKGFTSVDVTQASGDQGIDVLAKKNGVTYAIQCKCYSGNVGNSAVQEAFAGKSFYKRDIAMVMTNAQFTDSAVELANSIGVILWGDIPYSPQHMGAASCKKKKSLTSTIIDIEKTINTEMGRPVVESFHSKNRRKKKSISYYLGKSILEFLKK